jgi:hypothetical protein
MHDAEVTNERMQLQREDLKIHPAKEVHVRASGRGAAAAQREKEL